MEDEEGIIDEDKGEYYAELFSSRVKMLNIQVLIIGFNIIL